MIVKSPFNDLDIPSVSLPAYVTAHFEDYGEQIAFINGATGEELTYQQLFDDIKRVAFSLKQKGFGPGDTLALYSPNCPEYAVVFFAVTWLGGINTTINPTYTAEELAYQLNDSGARILITIPAILEKAKEAAGAAGIDDVFVIGGADEFTSYQALLGEGMVNAPAACNPENDLVVLPYSSGTTGLPKGVMLTHKNIVSNIAQTEHIEPAHGEVLIGILPFYHIYGMTVIMSIALRGGATIVTMPRFDLEHFLELMQTYSVTVAYLVPPIILGLAKHPLVDKYDLSSLKQITSGAAPLSGALADACGKRLNCVVKQGYGLTETSPVTHITPLGRKIKPGSVGNSIPCTETMIVDVATDQPLRPGETGEIWVRGPQVMKGYHKNEVATKAMIDENGWLHTGDIGYVDEEGYLYVIDRVKELIKYKGLQVAPAELEAVVIAHPDVADAAVIPSPDEEAGEVPKAFVVLKPGATPSADDIKSFVAGRVAPYKKIRKLEFIDQIPKVPSGKILRRELVKRERGEA